VMLSTIAVGALLALASLFYDRAQASRFLHPTLSILHPTRYTSHPTPYTRRPTPDYRHLTPYTLHPTPDARHPTTEALHPTSYTLYPTPYISKLELETRNSKLSELLALPVLRLCANRSLISKLEPRNPKTHTVNPKP